MHSSLLVLEADLKAARSRFNLFLGLADLLAIMGIENVRKTSESFEFLFIELTTFGWLVAQRYSLHKNVFPFSVVTINKLHSHRKSPHNKFPVNSAVHVLLLECSERGREGVHNFSIVKG